MPAVDAAVEAARAGFAVVADEVRNLAQRRAQAARETGETIASALKNNARGAPQLAEREANLGR